MALLRLLFTNFDYFKENAFNNDLFQEKKDARSEIISILSTFDFLVILFENPWSLFISGERSKFVGKEDEDEIREVIPNAEIVWLKDCGHLLHVEKQKEFCERVVSFLEKNNW